MNTLSTNNNITIFASDGKYKFCSQKLMATYYGIGYSKMRALIADLLPKRKSSLLTPIEVKLVDDFVNKNERPAKK